MMKWFYLIDGIPTRCFYDPVILNCRESIPKCCVLIRRKKSYFKNDFLDIPGSYKLSLIIAFGITLLRLAGRELFEVAKIILDTVASIMGDSLDTKDFVMDCMQVPIKHRHLNILLCSLHACRAARR